MELINCENTMNNSREPCYKWTFCAYILLCIVIMVSVHFYVGSQIETLWTISGSCRELHKDNNQSSSGPYTSASVPPVRCPREFSNEFSYRYHDLEQLSPFSANASASKVDDYTEKVLILTPISNARQFLFSYFKLLCALTYPHHLISVALGEDSSIDDTFEYASYIASQLKSNFRDVKVYHFDDTFKALLGEKRHKMGWQRTRRSHLAASRNLLLSHALKDESWVVWIDSDVAYTGPDIIQHLLSAKQPVVAPNCLWRGANGEYGLYDLNTWRETKESLEDLSTRPDDFLMVEGYSKTKRLYLRQIQNEGLVVPLDGVGGCVLLVEAECHRKGLVFPTFVFDHHIETEGLAKMANRMRIPVYGMPFVNVVH